MAGLVPGREPDLALPLAALGRRRRLRLGERPRHDRARGGGRGRLRDRRRTVGARLAPRVGRLRDLPGPVRVVRATPPSGPTGRSPGPGTSSRRAAAGRRRSSSSAATSRGIEQHLDHIESLGANVIYLTPFFPAELDTTATTRPRFDHVDPLLGGDEALASLARGGACARHQDRRRPDAQPHGHRHEWFLAAQASPSAPERAFYYFDDALPHGYESWLGAPDAAEARLAQRGAPRRAFGAVLRRYLELGLDGWRIDVANMVGRYRDLDLNREVVDVGARRRSATLS